MKKFSAFLILSILAGAPLLAEVKPAGTVLASQCGSTSTFPFTTEFCIAVVQGSKNTYLSLNSYNSEAVGQPNGPGNKSTTNYLKIEKTVKKGNTTTYTATGVLSTRANEDSRAREIKVEVVITTLPTGNIATIKRDGKTIFGGESVEMNYIMHTESLQ
jgi:hypothetical protein